MPLAAFSETGKRSSFAEEASCRVLLEPGGRVVKRGARRYGVVPQLLFDEEQGIAHPTARVFISLASCRGGERGGAPVKPGERGPLSIAPTGQYYVSYVMVSMTDAPMLSSRGRTGRSCSR